MSKQEKNFMDFICFIIILSGVVFCILDIFLPRIESLGVGVLNILSGTFSLFINNYLHSDSKEKIIEHIFKVVVLLIVLTISVLITLIVVKSMGDVVCEEFEVKPVRYDSSLFGKKMYITTDNNADEYKEVCVKRYEGEFFKPVQTIDRIVEYASELEVKEDGKKDKDM